MRKTIEQLTQALNEFQEHNNNNVFLNEQLADYLAELGFSRNIATSIMAKYFPSEKVGRAKMYSVPKNPITKSQVNAIYDNYKGYRAKYKAKTNVRKTPQTKEQECVAYLKSLGYRMMKPTGKFDMDRFQKEQETMFRRYSVYEPV